VITGGAGGIGRVTASKFASEGARVVIADVDAAGARAAAEMISRAGGDAVAIHTDVTRYEDVEAAIALAVSRYARFDVLFNCAATLRRNGLLDHQPDDFDIVVRVIQYGVFHGILAAARALRDRASSGCIINMVSVFAYMATSGIIGYHAAKGAVRAMTQAAALELAPLGIRVVGVAPGGVDTPLFDVARQTGFEREAARRHMRRRMIDPARVADVVLFLASPEADAINGTIVLVDDGYVAFK
jgi:NAD(P)-dependent dehydrogenase (short-subunit alcohol dehydrogenase family)